MTDKHIGIVGLGYVGLPLAISFTEAGLQVTGVDTSPSRVETLTNGRSPIDDIEDARLRAALNSGLQIRLNDPAQLRPCDVIIVCVPTPISRSKDPDLTPVISAAESVQAALRPGHLVILQSTTFPGTTNGPFRMELERSGLVAGRDFDLAFAPERVNPGDPASSGRKVPRLVGGTTPEATQRAKLVFEHINATVVPLSSPDTAELAKLLENVFRNVNIALVNQLALLCERMNIDVWEVIDAAATKPFGFMPFRPGPGVGGHCIPVDPYYLAWRAREFDFVDRFIELAGDINLAMPRHVVDLAAQALNEVSLALRGARVGVVGVAFKPNVQDARNTPASDVIALLLDRGAIVTYHDPYVPEVRDAKGGVHQSVGLDSLLNESQLIVVVTAHACLDWEAIYEHAKLVLDTCNSSRGRARASHRVLRLGAGWAGTRPAETAPSLPTSSESPRHF
jgi:UDP-N-acetyl-D-glucosamine dehydrogenase